MKRVREPVGRGPSLSGRAFVGPVGRREEPRAEGAGARGRGRGTRWGHGAGPAPLSPAPLPDGPLRASGTRRVKAGPLRPGCGSGGLGPRVDEEVAWSISHSRADTSRASGDPQGRGPPAGPRRGSPEGPGRTGRGRERGGRADLTHPRPPPPAAARESPRRRSYPAGAARRRDWALRPAPAAGGRSPGPLGCHQGRGGASRAAPAPVPPRGGAEGSGKPGA